MLLCARNVFCIKKTFCNISCNYNTYVTTTKRDFKEISIKVPWGQIAGKWWHPYDLRPILSLHGWQVI